MPDAQCPLTASIVMAGIDALIDDIQSHTPQSVLEAVVQEIDRVTGDLAEEFGNVTANRLQQREAYTELTRRHLALSADAEAAILAKREDLTRAAVAEQLEVEAQLPVIPENLRLLAKREKELFTLIDALLCKRLELESQLQTCRARMHCPVTATDIARALGPSGQSLPGSRTDAPAERNPPGNAISCGDCSGNAMAAKLVQRGECVQSKKIDERIKILKAGKS